MKLFLVFLLLGAPVYAQDFPFKPLPTVRVRLTDGTRKWYEPLPVRRKTADAHFWERTIASQLLTVGDIENSIYALRKPGVEERSPIYGKHPTRAIYYPISEAVFAWAAWTDYRYTREDSALRDAGLPGHRFIKGWLPQALNAGSHAVGIIFTIASTHR